MADLSTQTDDTTTTPNQQNNTTNDQTLQQPTTRAQRKQHNACEKFLKNLNKNPYVKHMIEEMEKLGCPVTEKFFSCRNCPVESEGFYLSKIGITLCENHLISNKHREVVARHELVHAYDTCRAHVKVTDCVHLACSEIRAANLSGECYFGREVLRGNVDFRRHHPACVKRRALLSLSSWPHCSKESRKFLKQAWSRCYRDTAPFDFVP
eukprot:TRINITY_DN1409_c0_g1_i4.p1 TRINITY_DN1409_c0_g1~~TRINITY_DN1409_c0_g1_i4.p1  ORF type:complete len:209 (+),score=34.73 TRINITY_DN1409_c0_g1_i4:130-756(+)